MTVFSVINNKMAKKKKTAAKPVKKSNHPDPIDELLNDINQNTNIPRGFQVPDLLLNQLNECSNGGFVLFMLDDSGSPRIYKTYDSDMHALALDSFVQKYGDSMEQINGQMVFDTLAGPQEPEDENPTK